MCGKPDVVWPRTQKDLPSSLSCNQDLHQGGEDLETRAVRLVTGGGLDFLFEDYYCYEAAKLRETFHSDTLGTKLIPFLIITINLIDNLVRAPHLDLL